MSLSSDLNLIDFFLDTKNEPILNGNDKDTIKNEEKTFILPEQWDGSQEEMFGNFKFDFDDPAFLPLFEGLTNENYSVPESNCSDSGMSSDLQMSPMVQEEDEETTNIVTTPQFQDDMQIIYTDQDIESHEEIELDSSDVSFIETNNSINVETFEESNVIETQLEEPKEKKRPPKTYNQTQVLKVTPLLGNSRPVLLPISLKDLREMKTIKIIKQPSPSFSSPEKIPSTNSSPRMKSSNSTESHTSSDEGELHYPRLELTPEEKKLLQKEGVRLPEYYPLTKQEERELKRIRRKIRNKISAQDSRKRKKEYIDGLEDRVKKCTEENLNLVKRIKQLENQKDILQSQKETLVAQIRKLQAVVSKTGGKAVQPTTCLMVLMLSMALVMMPSMRGNGSTNSEMSSEKEQLTLSSEKPMPLAGRSRSLLFKSPLDENEQLMDGEKLPTTEKLIADLEQLLQFRPRMFEENIMIDEDELFGPSSAKRRFIIPPLDDVWPPPPDEKKNITLQNSFSLGKTLQNSFSLGNETKKMNISDAGGTRSIVLPKDI